MSSVLEKPLLEVVCSAENSDGRLIRAFRLPAENEKQKDYLDGAIDGMLMFHAILNDPSELEGYKKLKNAIDYASEGKRQEALDLVAEFCKSSQILPLLDSLHSYIMENQATLHPDRLLSFAIELFSKGTKREAVKFGIMLMGMFDLSSMPEVKKFLMYIGACEEFTYYVAHVMSTWENGNEEVFQLLKKVFGWGKILALDVLKPETEEIRNWMVTQGYRNGISAQYSALTIAKACNLVQMMRNKITLEQYFAIIDIVGALLNEKPVPGISGIENPQEFMEAFDECLVLNASYFQNEMTPQQRARVEQVMNARAGRK